MSEFLMMVDKQSRIALGVDSDLGLYDGLGLNALIGRPSS